MKNLKLFICFILLIIPFNAYSQFSLVNSKRIIQNSFSFSIVKGDFNEDGKMDFITNGENGLILNTNLGNGEFAAGQVISGTSTSVFIATSDLNNDGHLDLVYDDYSMNLYIFFGNGDNTFTLNRTIDTYNNIQGIPKAIKLTDINNDSVDDIVIGYENSNRFSFYLNDGLGNFGTQENIPTLNETTILKIISGDLNNDNFNDLFIVDYARYQTRIYLNNGGGTFTEINNPYSNSLIINSEISDFDNNGINDIVLFDASNNKIEVYLNQSLLSGSSPSQFDLNALFVNSSTTIDINQDGFLDLVVTGPDDCSYFINDGLGGFTSPVSNILNLDQFCDYESVVHDFNEDGDFEILGLSAGTLNFVSLIKDSDSDGIGDNIETLLGINPNNPDSDGDGITDSAEITLPSTAIDTDLDGVINALDIDDDGDGISTAVEVAQGILYGSDFDRDNIPNYLDTDSDNDGLADATELDVDNNGNGLLDYLQGVDIDGDGYFSSSTGGTDCDDASAAIYPGAQEILDGIDNNCNGATDELDNDLDGLFDGIELSLGTDPYDPDTDNDGLNDGIEYNDELNYYGYSDIDQDGTIAALDTDSDNDGILDGTESGDSNGNGLPDYLEASPVVTNKDADGDGFISYQFGGTDCDDATAATHPYAVDQLNDGIDSDCNGIDAGLNLDSDFDGIADDWELVYDFSGLLDPNNADTDGDGILDGYEVGNALFYGTDVDSDGLPNYIDSDSDGDGITDLADGTGDSDNDGLPNYLDPSGLVVLDTDSDGILDSDEIALGLNLNSTDSDTDGVTDNLEITLPNTAFDSDSDGTIDALDTDDDNDGILTTFEIADGLIYGNDTDVDGIPNYLDLDSDGDGIFDAIESITDANGNGIPNYLEICTKPLTSAISGSIAPCAISSQLIYRVTSTTGSVYNWTVTSNIEIADGNGTSRVKVNFLGFDTGTITVIETALDGCVGDPISLNLSAAEALYEIPTLSITCKNMSVTVPILAVSTVPNSIIGMNISLAYDPSVLTATGTMSLGNVVTAGNSGASFIINTKNPGKVLINIYFNSSLRQQFNGSGTVAAVNFNLLQPLAVGASTSVQAVSIREGYPLGNAIVCAKSGAVHITEDYMLYGTIFLRGSSTVLGYNSGVPSRFLATSITGSDASCNTNTSVVRPDVNGNFSINLNQSSKFQLSRDINASTSVQTYINSTDALRASEIAVGLGADPSIYEILAADVNGDGVIVGDNTLIMQRSVRTITQFGTGRDWVFFDKQELSSNPAYSISSTYPFNDEVGFSSENIPIVPNCIDVRRESDGLCTFTPLTSVIGVLLGDVNGNFLNNPNTGLRLSNEDEVIFDINNAKLYGKDTLGIPVLISTSEPMKSLDLVMDYNQSNLIVSDMSTTNNNSVILFNDFKNDSLYIGSYNLNGLESNSVWATVKFVLKSDVINIKDLSNAKAIINDKPANVRIEASSIQTSIKSFSKQNGLIVYPNPSSGSFVISNSNKDVTKFTIFNLNGIVVNQGSLQLGETKVDTELPSGVYFILVGDKRTKLVIE